MSNNYRFLVSFIIEADTKKEADDNMKIILSAAQERTTNIVEYKIEQGPDNLVGDSESYSSF